MTWLATVVFIPLSGSGALPTINRTENALARFSY